MSVPNYALDEGDVLKSFQLLGHRYKEGEWTELRIIDTVHNQVKKQVWVNNEEDYLNVCLEWNGRANIYHGLNPRSSEGAGSSADVKRITIIPIDIDPDRPKGTASTNKQLNWAISEANKIKNWLRDNGFKQPVAAISGNGVHLLLSVDISIEDPDNFRDKVKTFYSKLPISIDTSCSDPARIFKVYGTWSVKGEHTEETPHRLAKIIDLGDYEADEKLAEYVLSGKKETIDLDIKFSENTEESVKQKLYNARKNERLNNLLNGDWKQYDDGKGKWSRSEAEFSLVQSLFFYGLSPDDVNQIMLNESKIGKWQESKETYRKRTLEKAYENYLSNPFRFFSDNKFVTTRLSEEIQREHMFLATSEKSAIWRYNTDNGIWDTDGLTVIQESAKNKLKSKWKSHYSNEAAIHIRVSNYVKPEQLGGPLNKLVCSNGVVDLVDGSFTDFNPTLYAISGVPVKYDPTAMCPTIDAFINEVVGEEDVPKFFELAGYCLYKAYPIARFVIFHGEKGSGGKSTALKLITAMLGDQNVSSLNIQNLVDEGFRGSSLFRKLANISGDLPSKPIAETGFIKKCTGGDMITIEKKFQDPFDFYNHAKLIFSANQVPPPKYDDTGAFYRRTLLIEFPKHFADGEPGTDPKLIEKLTTPEELSGFLNKSLEGLKNLLERGKFSKEKPVDERKLSYMLESNQIQYFAVNYVSIDTDPEHYVTNEDLYRFYVFMCRNLEKTPTASNVFSREFRRWIAYAYQGTTTISGRKIKVWRGLTVDVGKLQYSYEVKEPPKKGQKKLGTVTDVTDRPDVSPFNPITDIDFSGSGLLSKTSVTSVTSVTHNPLKHEEQIGDQPLIDLAKRHLNNNGGGSSTADLVKWLTQNGYDFDAFKKLKPYISIFKFDGSKVSLAEVV